MAVTILWLTTESTRQMLGGDTVDARFESMILDGTVSETYDVEALATEHPVEDDVEITDHVKPQLQRISLDIVVSAHPGPSSPAQADLSGWTGTARDNPSYRPQFVRETLRRLIREGVEVDIETGAGAWESMLLVAMSEARSSESGDGLRARVDAREFRRVSTQEVEAPSPRVERGRRSADRGDQDGTEADGTAATGSSSRSTALELLRSLNPSDFGGQR